jgi:hypothetical protein
LGTKRQVFHISILDNTKTMMDIGAGVGVVVTEEPKTPSSLNSQDIANLVIEDVESEGESNMVGEVELAVVPEASPVKSASRWNKRCAGDTDEDSLKRASKLKAQRTEGDNNPNPLSLNISDSYIQTKILVQWVFI